MKKKIGFTLAEVLITLAVIGVVAALTIPTLVQNYKKKVVETKLSQFYTMMNQAVKLSEIDNGEQSTWLPNSGDYSIEEYFNKYFAPYLKVVKTEPEDDCTIRVYLANGTVMKVSKADSAWYHDPHFKLYINGTTNGSVCGKDMFVFKQVIIEINKNLYRQGGITPYTTRYPSGWDDISDDEINKILREDEGNGCSSSSSRYYCAALIMRNGWKIPDDYPIKF